MWQNTFTNHTGLFSYLLQHLSIFTSVLERLGRYEGGGTGFRGKRFKVSGSRFQGFKFRVPSFGLKGSVAKNSFGVYQGLLLFQESP